MEDFQREFVAGFAGLLVTASLLLLLHHRYHHRTGGPAPLPAIGFNQWFQLSDVCNFHSCSHEMWIICMVSVAGILFIYLASTTP